MTEKDKKRIEIAETLGYDKTAVARETMEDAINFVEKIANRLPENDRHQVMYAVQVVINTLTMDVARKVLAQEEEKNGPLYL